MKKCLEKEVGTCHKNNLFFLKIISEFEALTVIKNMLWYVANNK